MGRAFRTPVLLPPSASASAPINLGHGTAPSSPQDGDVWATSTGLYARINGTTVGPLSGAGANITVADSAPGTPVAGSMWFDSTSGRMYVYYDSFWVEIGTPGGIPIVRPFVAKTADYTLSLDDEVVAVSAASGVVTITLPLASGLAGKQYIVKKTDSSRNAVVVDGNGSETIDGRTTQSLTAQYEALTIVGSGTEWLIV